MTQTSHHKIQKTSRGLMAILCGVFLFITLMPQPSYAVCVGRCCNCNSVRNAIIDEVKKHQDWLVSDFWGKNVEPAIDSATASIESFILGNAALDGNVIEGQSNIDSIRGFQEQVADSVVNTRASEALCRFGSLSKSLAASEVKVQEKVLNLSKASLDRELLRQGQKSAEGTTQDLTSRFETFKRR